ncbi:MAG: malonyl-CoA synthase [Pseudomonadota bacterium]
MTNHLATALGLADPARHDRRFASMEDGRHYSYAHVEQVSARFAAALVALGVTPGDRVAVQVDKSIEAVMLYLGAVRAGAIFLPLNTAYTAAEINYFLGDAEPALFVCAPAHHDALAPVAARHNARIETMGVWTPEAADNGSLFGHIPEAAAFDDIARTADDLAAILYTSGTTGRSKGAMLSHANLASNAETLAAHWRFTPEDVLIHALPIFHTHGLFVATNTALVAGSALLFRTKFDPVQTLQDMAKATALMGVPTFYTRLLDQEGLTREATNAMRLFVSGSAPLLAETHERWHARTGHAILERYGMTETNMNTSNPYEGVRRAGTVGQALPGVEVIVTDPESGQALPTGETGMVEVRGPNVFQGYWRMPEKTAEEKRDNGFFITGDLGRYDEDGYLSIVGRAKDLVISGGYNVYPKEVETALDTVEGVVESAVIGLPHPDFGEGVAAVVVRSDAALTEEALVAAVAGDLARYKQPRRVFFVEALPRNTMGKVQKKDLRQTYAEAFQPEAKAG